MKRTILMAGLLFILSPASVWATTYFVNAGTGNDGNDCLSAGAACATVQHAIEIAREKNSSDTINVATGTYTGQMIFDVDGGVVNPPVKSYTVVGAGAKQTFFDGEKSTNVVLVDVDIHVDLSRVTIQNGQESGSGIGGAGVRNTGETLLHECVIKDNVAKDSNGGGIGNVGTMKIANCTISGNSSVINGGGISNGGKVNGDFETGSLEITNSTISGNTSGAGGGGIFSGKCSSSNPSDCDPPTPAQSSISLINVTIANNTSNAPPGEQLPGGGGIQIESGTSGIGNTLIANNTDNSSNNSDDCSGSLGSIGHNLIEETHGCAISGITSGNVTALDPVLGPLQDNGGDSQTHALLSGGPAIDTPTSPAIDAALEAICPTSDQRGEARPIDGDSDGIAICDIGAFEAAKAGGGTAGTTGGNGGSGGCTLNAFGPSASSAWAFTIPAVAALALLRRRSKA